MCRAGRAQPPVLGCWLPSVCTGKKQLLSAPTQLLGPICLFIWADYFQITLKMGSNTDHGGQSFVCVPSANVEQCIVNCLPSPNGGLDTARERSAPSCLPSALSAGLCGDAWGCAQVRQTLLCTLCFYYHFSLQLLHHHPILCASSR